MIHISKPIPFEFCDGADDDPRAHLGLPPIHYAALAAQHPVDVERFL
jgi:hypothetical protein